MKKEIILKIENKREITEEGKKYNKFLFRLVEENGDLILYVNELFYSKNSEIQKKIIETILSSTFVNNMEKNLLSNYNIKSQKIIKDYIFLYFLNANIQIVEIFRKMINKLKLKEKLINLFIEDNISLDKFIQIITTHTPPIKKEDKTKLISSYSYIESLTLYKEEKTNEILKGISVSDKVKGDIFQLLCSRIIFNNNDKYLYNLSSGVKGNLYPDLMYKIKDNLNTVFICDAKCYTDDEQIKPHKEFLYNILTSHVNNKKTVIGLLFTYEKTNISNKPYIIKKIHKFAGHYFYLFSLNINILLENLIRKNKISYATEMGELILENHDDIKKEFNTKQEIIINGEKVKLINYKYNSKVTEFINS